MIKLVIFDMDGVLVDACEWHKIALNEALKKTYNYQISESDHYSIYNGLPTKIKLKKLNELGIIKQQDFPLIESLKQQNTIEIIKSSCREDISKIKLVDFLINKNIKVACYTNSINTTAKMMLELIGIYDKLDLLLTNNDVKNPKPDPEGYNLCCHKLNIDKKNCLIIEDSFNGILAAQKSEIPYIKVRDATEVNIELFKEII